MSTVTKDKEQVESDPEEEARLERIRNKPDITECFNLLDFEVPPLFTFYYQKRSADNLGGGKTSDEEKCLGILFIRRG